MCDTGKMNQIMWKKHFTGRSIFRCNNVRHHLGDSNNICGTGVLFDYSVKLLMVVSR